MLAITWLIGRARRRPGLVARPPRRSRSGGSGSRLDRACGALNPPRAQAAWRRLIGQRQASVWNSRQAIGAVAREDLMMDNKDINVLASRLREHPVTRGIGDSQTLDIAAALEQLRAEEHPAVHGHRQVTLFHRPPLTLVLFAFDADGLLPDHVAQGLVSIQVIDGSLTVQAAGVDHRLDAQQILLLDPAVAHSVRAGQPSAMLLSVHQVAAAGRDADGSSD
jgi:quercetin dioxygenase-like cupin family protein